MKSHSVLWDQNLTILQLCTVANGDAHPIRPINSLGFAAFLSTLLQRGRERNLSIIHCQTTMKKIYTVYNYSIQTSVKWWSCEVVGQLF